MQTWDDIEPDVRKLVAEWLELGRFTEPPVNCFDLAIRLGWQLVNFSPTGKRASAIRRDKTLYLDATETPERRNWSAGHEILENSLVFEADTPPEAREKLTELAVAQLLFPAEWWKDAWRTCGPDLYELKKLFGLVSYQATAHRMEDELDAVCRIFDNQSLTVRHRPRGRPVPDMQSWEKRAIERAYETWEPVESRCSELNANETIPIRIKCWPIPVRRDIKRVIALTWSEDRFA